jgi:hypothetical protein
MNDEPIYVSSESSRDLTSIDLHPKAAGLNLFIGGLITFVYYAGFSDFKTTTMPWKVTGSLTLISSAVLLVQYFLNRSRRRLIWEGIAAIFGLLPIWLLLGSCWLAYFLFAPMPVFVRWSVLLPCLAGTIYWLIVVWRDYESVAKRRGLLSRLYRVEGDRIVYSIEASTVVLTLKQRSPFSRLHFWGVSLAPLLGGIALSSVEHFQSASGPHGVFLILSFFSYPMSQWMLAYLGMRTVFFHVYLPRKIEKETAKKVILAP